MARLLYEQDFGLLHWKKAGWDYIGTLGGPEDVMDHFIEKRINEDNKRMGDTSNPTLAYIGKT